MARELLVYDLPAEDQEFFNKVYGDDKSNFSDDGHGNKRELVGWYVRKELRVKFYYKPSWFSRMKMYWISGWSWEDKASE